MLKLTNFNELALAIMLECWNYLQCFFIPEKTFFKIFYLSEFSTSNTFKIFYLSEVRIIWFLYLFYFCHSLLHTPQFSHKYLIPYLWFTLLPKLLITSWYINNSKSYHKDAVSFQSQWSLFLQQQELTNLSWFLYNSEIFSNKANCLSLQFLSIQMFSCFLSSNGLVLFPYHFFTSIHPLLVYNPFN